jgi:predicted RNase H-like HicB family nuclease
MRLTVKIIHIGPNGFRAVCPSLPGCHARGRSQQEAVENIHTAIQGYLASMNAVVPQSIEPLVQTA